MEELCQFSHCTLSPEPSGRFSRDPRGAPKARHSGQGRKPVKLLVQILNLIFFFSLPAGVLHKEDSQLWLPSDLPALSSGAHHLTSVSPKS